MLNFFFKDTEQHNLKFKTKSFSFWSSASEEGSTCRISFCYDARIKKQNRTEIWIEARKHFTAHVQFNFTRSSLYKKCCWIWSTCFLTENHQKFVLLWNRPAVSSLSGFTFRQVKRDVAQLCRFVAVEEPVGPSGRSSKVLGGLKSVSPSLHRLLLLQLDLCGRTFPHDCRENRDAERWASRCRSDVRSEEIKPADVHLTSCYFHRSSLISDFKLKSTKTYWCLGVKSKFDLTGSWASTEWTWAHRALTTHVVNVPKWPSTPQTVPDVNMMHSDSFSLRAASV